MRKPGRILKNIGRRVVTNLHNLYVVYSPYPTSNHGNGVIIFENRDTLTDSEPPPRMFLLAVHFTCISQMRYQNHVGLRM